MHTIQFLLRTGCPQLLSPTFDDKKMFAQNLHNITSKDLGNVVQLLEQRCKACIKKIGQDTEIEDAIDISTFWAAGAYKEARGEEQTKGEGCDRRHAYGQAVRISNRKQK